MGLWRDKNRKDWRYSFQFRGKSYAGGGFKTRTAAGSAREDRRKEIKISLPSIHGDLALSQAIAQYLDHSEKRFVKKTHDYKKYVLESFYRMVGDVPIASVSWQVLGNYLETRPSAHNFNVHRKELQTFFHFAERKLKVLHDNPVKNIERMPEKKSVKYIPPKEDVLKLLNAATVHERPLLLVLLHSLARIDEILRLTWEDIDFENSTVRLWTRKTSNGSLTPDTLPMNQELSAVLGDLHSRRKQNKWVFYFNRNHGRYNRRPKFMRVICERAKVRPFGFHSLRHFAATYLASRPGVSHKTLSGLLRHRALATTEIYLQSLDDAQREAVKELEGLFPLAGDACGSGKKRPKKAASGAKRRV